MAESSILISAIICTHNRATLLDHALYSLANQTLDKTRYEVIIVDNASADNTQGVVEAWTRQHRNFRYVYEPSAGLSHARNRGAAEANAPIVAYMDDDCVAQPNWLAGLLEGFQSDPQSACVGGRIHLKWERGERPDWISDGLLSVFGFLDLGDLPQELRHANGGNMAWNRQELLQLGGFPIELGRRGSLRLAGEESTPQYKAREQGLHVRYAPRALVHHYVPAQRQSRSYALQTCFMIGKSSAISDHADQPSSRLVSLKWVSRDLLRAWSPHVHLATAWLTERRWVPRAQTMYWLCLCAISWGTIRERVRFFLDDFILPGYGPAAGADKSRGFGVDSQ